MQFLNPLHMKKEFRFYHGVLIIKHDNADANRRLLHHIRHHLLFLPFDEYNLANLLFQHDSNLCFHRKINPSKIFAIHGTTALIDASDEILSASSLPALYYFYMPNLSLDLYVDDIYTVRLVLQQGQDELNENALYLLHVPFSRRHCIRFQLNLYDMFPASLNYESISLL